MASLVAGRRPRQNPIRGPHSALTDFLASNNISANQIYNDYQQRVQAAQNEAAQNGADNEDENANEDEVEAEAQDDEADEELEQQQKNRKRKQKATLEKIKKSKEEERRKLRRLGDKKRILPGQFANCDICEKRFTVTAYSKTGPSGGLLCHKCSKEVADEEKKAKPKKSGAAKKGRRQAQSNLLDGFVQRGAPQLVETCIKVSLSISPPSKLDYSHAAQKIADNIHDIEEFGALPDTLMLRLSMILSKKRAITPRSLELFLHADGDTIDLFDCAKLNEEDFHKIFAYMPNLVNVNIQVANQLKNPVLEYMIERCTKVKHIQLDTTNLITDEAWRKLFQARGPALESLKLSNLDCSLDDESVKQLAQHCPNLRTLELTEVWKNGDATLDAISTMPNLEHLTLDFIKDTTPSNLVNLISTRGPKLRTLALHNFKDSDDTLLSTIHTNCTSLRELTFNENALCTDSAFVSLFTNWTNPPLQAIDFSSTRCMDNTDPHGPDDHPIGLGSEGFKALMTHSGPKLERLDIHSCRHISHAAWSEVFREGAIYPKLKELDIAFHPVLDDYLMGRIFQCCPALTKVVAFGCFGIRDVRIPPGVALIGALNAQDPVVVEGGFVNTLAEALFPSG
ncbi:hypothetical protein FQN54_000623 [Arachnomyces sp. PD_36]|nr:hypothetical protein FQN54_000623 [Arachnomyces sp. PD_36]